MSGVLNWEADLDNLGPFADPKKLEALLKSAPAGCPDADLLRVYLQNLRGTDVVAPVRAVA